MSLLAEVDLPHVAGQVGSLDAAVAALLMYSDNDMIIKIKFIAHTWCMPVLRWAAGSLTRALATSSR